MSSPSAPAQDVINELSSRIASLTVENAVKTVALAQALARVRELENSEEPAQEE